MKFQLVAKRYNRRHELASRYINWFYTPDRIVRYASRYADEKTEIWGTWQICSDYMDSLYDTLGSAGVLESWEIHRNQHRISIHTLDLVTSEASVMLEKSFIYLVSPKGGYIPAEPTTRNKAIASALNKLGDAILDLDNIIGKLERALSFDSVYHDSQKFILYDNLPASIWQPIAKTRLTGCRKVGKKPWSERMDKYEAHKISNYTCQEVPQNYSKRREIHGRALCMGRPSLDH